MGSCLGKKKSNDASERQNGDNSINHSLPTSPTPTTGLKTNMSASQPTVVKEEQQRVTLTIDDAHRQSWNMEPIDSNLNLNGDDATFEHQLKIEEQEAEQKFQKEEMQKQRKDIFESQLNRQEACQFITLGAAFSKYAINKQYLDEETLAQALAEFGMNIDFDKNLKKMVFDAFDIEQSQEIDVGDFSSMMSYIFTSEADDALLILFQIFDWDQDGFLEQMDIARILLSQNHFGIVATGQNISNSEMVTFSKKECLKQAKKMICEQSNDSDKVSFEQFKVMMAQFGQTETDLMFQFMDRPTISRKMISAPKFSNDCITIHNVSPSGNHLVL